MIQNVTGTRPAAAERRGAIGRSRAVFRIEGDRTSTPAAAIAIAPVELNAVLSVQEHEADAADDRAARRNGDDILDELAAVQRDLLTGGVTATRLQRVAALAEVQRQTADPALRVLVEAIALRARVELARFEGAVRQPVR
ncbi:MAG: hypothetical protein JO326_04050 [Acetobacteraceae bacterium]|nr:hypothetical protein [Acetobacteraceae bacterium]